MSKKKISKALKIKILILTLMAGILFTSSNLMPLVNAQPIPTSLTIAVSSPLQEKECTIEATLKDENGNPLQNMDIRFLICGSEMIGTNKTDSSGVASLKLTNNAPLFYYPELNPFETTRTGTMKINAMFKGTTNYTRSSSEDVYFTFIFIDYTPYMVGGGLIAVAIIGVVGYIIFRRRKKAIPMPMTTKEA